MTDNTFISPKSIKKFVRVLTKRLTEVVKKNTPRWFGVKFNKKWTPFNIKYNSKEKTLYLWGIPPNENIDKSSGASKRVPWGKTMGRGSSEYKWHSPHFHRVYIGTPSNGFWYSAKTKWGGDGKTFYTRSSHNEVVITGKRWYSLDKSKSRKYPFPAKWYISGHVADFAYDQMAITDKLMSEEPLVNEIIASTLDEVLEIKI